MDPLLDFEIPQFYMLNFVRSYDFYKNKIRLKLKIPVIVTFYLGYLTSLKLYSSYNLQKLESDIKICSYYSGP